MQKWPSSLPKIGALDAKSRLKEMKSLLSEKLILGRLNSNSIRNMFEALKFIINHNIDIFDIRRDKGGGLPLYIREDIPSKILKYSSNCDIETLLVKISLRKRKWFLNGFCDLNKSQVVIILNV